MIAQYVLSFKNLFSIYPYMIKISEFHLHQKVSISSIYQYMLKTSTFIVFTHFTTQLLLKCALIYMYEHTVINIRLLTVVQWLLPVSSASLDSFVKCHCFIVIIVHQQSSVSFSPYKDLSFPAFKYRGMNKSPLS